MGLDLYSRIEHYLEFDEEVKHLHSEFLSIIFEKNLDNILDIGCGQGAFLNHLRANNKTACGIDLSQEQINICDSFGLNAQCKPIAQVEGLYDCATAIFDVVNYIPPTDIKSFITEVSLALNQGGYFIFDVNSHYGFQDVAQGSLNLNLEDKFISIDAHFEEEQLKTDITLFTQCENGLYEKEHDCITQYFYEIKFLKKALKEAHFKVENIISFHLHCDEVSDKLIFICKKQ